MSCFVKALALHCDRGWNREGFVGQNLGHCLYLMAKTVVRCGDWKGEGTKVATEEDLCPPYPLQKPLIALLPGPALNSEGNSYKHHF